MWKKIYPTILFYSLVALTSVAAFWTAGFFIGLGFGYGNALILSLQTIGI